MPQEYPAEVASVAKPGIIRRFLRWWAHWPTRRQFALPCDGHIRAARALQTLKNNLTPTQREQFETHECFDVVGGTTGTRYRIWWGHQLNVQELDGRHRHGQWLCFLPSGNLPVGDNLLAQKVALEVCEEAALHVAQRSSQRLHPPPSRW